MQQVMAALGQDVDPLRSTFTAGNHSGLDAVLDILQVSFSDDTATLSNGLGELLFEDKLTDADDVAAKLADSTISSKIENLKSAATELPDASAGIAVLLASLTQKCGTPATVQDAASQLAFNTPGLYRYRLYDSSGNLVGEGRN